MKTITTTTFLFCFLYSATFSQNLLFKSGFEDTVEISSPIANGGQWYQYFTGTDLSTGYQWPQDFPIEDSMGAYWTFKVPDTSQLSDYASVKLDTVLDRNGDTTRALFMQITDYSNDNFSNSMQGHVRCEYRLNLDTTLTQAYIKYWVKLQPDFYDSITLFGTNRWRMLMEWFETGQTHADYRWNFSSRCTNLVSDTNSAYLRLSKQYQLGPGNPGDFITDSMVTNQRLTPVGEWFKLELYWKQAVDSTGRIWAAINGNTLFDFYGRNMNDTTPSPLSNWQIFKLYVDEPSMDDGNVYQWIDDVEIWDSIPEQVTGIPENIAANQLEIEVYPNPASSEFFIEELSGKEYEIKVFNSLGVLTFTQKNNEGGIAITIVNWAKGIYHIRISNSNQIINEKLIIQ